MSKNILGIDVAKRKIDVVLLFDNRALAKKFDNSEKGFKLLNGWLKSLHIDHAHVCLEATGTYSDGVARFLHEAGHLVSVVNPFCLKGYAASKLQRNKTDKADARIIADFCLTQEPEQWIPASPRVIKLQALARRVETLKEMLLMEKNRLDISPRQTKPSIKRMIRMFEKEIMELEKDIKGHIDQNPDLKEQTELLKSIPGIGEKTAGRLLSEIEFERHSSARSVAAYAGVTPRKKESGTSLNKTSRSKIGSGRIRKMLYFPAIVATQCNEVIKEFAARLAKNGKSKMQIVCAAMRKLLHIAFGVLKTKTPFDPNRAVLG
jgi:transposase